MRSLRRNIEKSRKKQEKLNRRINKAIFTFGLGAAMTFMVNSSSFADVSFPQAAQLDTNVTTQQNGDTFKIQHGNGQVFNNSWNSFDVPTAKTVDFNFSQNGQLSINRVVGNQVSQILGRITESGAGGKVFLLNPHGVMFGKDSSVNLGSFTVSTANLINADVEKGIYKFEQGSIPASIINEGNVKVSDEGFVALMAPVVKNTGTIEAKQGTIGLVSGNKYTLTTGTGQDVSIKVDEALSKNLVDSNEVSLINNSGTVKADGGSVIISAKAMDDVIQNAVNNTGLISANSVTEANGQIVLGNIAINADKTVELDGTIEANGVKGGNIDIEAQNVCHHALISAKGSTSDGGNVTIHSSDTNLGYADSVIDVSGNKGGNIHYTADKAIITSAKYVANGSGAKGGNIHISAPSMKLFSTQIDASGASGGQILLGGEKQGTNTGILSNSKYYLLSDGSSVKADALSSTGDGGEIINWSDGTSYIFGSLSAKPGELAGEGGFIEISGKENLGWNSSVITSSGDRHGTLLLDPKNIIIGSPTSITYNAAIYGGDYSSDGTAGNKIGSSVALYNNILGVGASGYNSGCGIVYLYTFGSNFSNITLKNTVSQGTSTRNFGKALALNNNKLLVGSNTGVYNYTYDKNSSNLSVTEIPINYGSPNNYDSFPTNVETGNITAVAISPNDNLLLISINRDLFRYSYTKDSNYNNLTLIKAFGYVVPVTALAIDENNFSALGMAEINRIEIHDPNGWATANGGIDNSSNTFTPGDTGTIGYSVAMSSGKIAYGTPYSTYNPYGDSTANCGRVYVADYSITDNTVAISDIVALNEVAKTSNSHPNVNFGSSVALFNGALAVGATNEYNSGQTGYSGAVQLFTISSIATSPVSAGSPFGNLPANDLTISASAIQAALVGGNVVLQANNDITLNQAISSAAGHDLTMQAGRSILLNANITNTGGGNLTLTANDTAATGANREDGNAAITMNSGTSINAGTGNVSIRLLSGTNGTYATGDITSKGITANNLTVSSTGAITGNGILDINGTTSLTAASTANITLNNTANDFTGAVSVVSGKDVTLNDTNAIDLGASTVSGNLTLVSNGAITQSGDLAVTGTTLLTAGSANNITLNRTGNNFGGTVSVVTGKDINIVDSNAMTLGSINSMGTIDIATLTGDLTISDNIATTDTSANAIKLNAGKNTAAGTSTGGDIKITATGTPITTGAGGTATLYTGSLSGSTGVVSSNVVASGSGKFRYNSDESATNYTTALTSGINAIYREQPIITVTANNDSKTYDGQTYTGGNGVTSSGYINGDTNTSLTGAVTYGGTSQGAVNANTYTITAGGLTNGFGYGMNFANGTLTVNKKALDVKVDASKTYGDTSASSLVTSLSGFVNGENETSAGITGAGGIASVDNNGLLGTANAGGTYHITSNAGNLAASNYSFNSSSNGLLTVNKKALEVRVDASKTYGDTSASSLVTLLSGFVNGENATSAGITGVGGIASVDNNGLLGTANAGGTYHITSNLGTLAANNYSFNSTSTGLLTVNKKALDVKVDASKAYGDTSASSLVTSLSGFVNGENATSAGITGTGGIASVNNNGLLGTANAGGTYHITSNAGNLAANNYSFNSTSTGLLTVNKKALDVKVDASKAYGDTSASSLVTSLSGFVNGENATSAGITGAGGIASVDNNGLLGTANAGGTYHITSNTGTLSANNYSFNSTSTGLLTVGKKGLTITGNDATRKKGQANPEFTAVYTGLVNADSESSLGTLGFTTTATNSSQPGTYDITPELTLHGVNYGNYDISYENGRLTVQPAVIPHDSNLGDNLANRAPDISEQRDANNINKSTTVMVAVSEQGGTGNTDTATASSSGEILSKNTLSEPDAPQTLSIADSSTGNSGLNNISNVSEPTTGNELGNLSTSLNDLINHNPSTIYDVLFSGRSLFDTLFRR